MLKNASIINVAVQPAQRKLGKLPGCHIWCTVIFLPLQTSDTLIHFWTMICYVSWKCSITVSADLCQDTTCRHLSRLFALSWESICEIATKFDRKKRSNKLTVHEYTCNFFFIQILFVSTRKFHKRPRSWELLKIRWFVCTSSCT